MDETPGLSEGANGRRAKDYVQVTGVSTWVSAGAL